MMMFAPDEIDRFWTHVAVTPSCWLWQLAPGHQGYGIFKVRDPRRNVRAHRYSYALEHGETFVVSGVRRTHELDHVCRRRLCVRPSHLEYVTQIENLKRQHLANWSPTCKHGHEKVIWRRVDCLGRSYCFACQRNAEARRQARRKVGG